MTSNILLAWVRASTPGPRLRTSFVVGAGLRVALKRAGIRLPKGAEGPESAGDEGESHVQRRA